MVTRRQVPWYLEEKIRRGAHAALVGLSIRDGAPSGPCGGSWRVVSVGDSCLFHVRDDTLLTVAPTLTSEEFDNHPHLISSNPSTSSGLDKSQLTYVSGEWLPSDVFYLLTDALAQWTLAKHEAGRPPWSLFRKLGRRGDKRSSRAGQRSFETLVAKLRKNDGLHNDDTTLLRVEVA